MSKSVPGGTKENHKISEFLASRPRIRRDTYEKKLDFNRVCALAKKIRPPRQILCLPNNDFTLILESYKNNCQPHVCHVNA